MFVVQESRIWILSLSTRSHWRLRAGNPFLYYTAAASQAGIIRLIILHYTYRMVANNILNASISTVTQDQHPQQIVYEFVSLWIFFSNFKFHPSFVSDLYHLLSRYCSLYFSIALSPPHSPPSHIPMGWTVQRYREIFKNLTNTELLKKRGVKLEILCVCLQQSCLHMIKIWKQSKKLDF